MSKKGNICFLRKVQFREKINVCIFAGCASSKLREFTFNTFPYGGERLTDRIRVLTDPLDVANCARMHLAEDRYHIYKVELSLASP